jgi:hypothetical protein
MPETEAMLKIAPLPPPIHMREHMLAAQEHALQVDVVGSRTVLTDSLTDAGFRFDDPLDR